MVTFFLKGESKGGSYFCLSGLLPQTTGTAGRPCSYSSCPELLHSPLFSYMRKPQHNFWKTVLLSHQKFRSPRGQVGAQSPVENKLGGHSPQPDPPCPRRELEGKADQLPFQTLMAFRSLWTDYCNSVSVFHVVRQQGLISSLTLSSHHITSTGWYTLPGRHLNLCATKDHHPMAGVTGVGVSMCLHSLLP